MISMDFSNLLSINKEKTGYMYREQLLKIYKVQNKL